MLRKTAAYHLAFLGLLPLPENVGSSVSRAVRATAPARQGDCSRPAQKATVRSFTSALRS
jgi:hypothetical protein